MAILDNRTALSGFETADTPAQPDDLSGAAGGTADTEIFIEGVRSWGYYTTTTRDGLLYDAGSAQNWANNTFYLWVNCGVAGLLDTLANGGMAVRFCGAAVGDWFEVNVAGSDAYPAAVAGGWVMLVVDIEKAKTASDRTGGTAPATNAIRYVGVTTITGGTMPRMVDNTWLDAMWRLPASTPGILVEGVNGGSDWTFADIASTAVAGSWGSAKVTAGGAIALNTPVRFGKNDAVTHGFTDTNAVVLWEDWDVAAGLYGFEVVGGTGVQSFVLGSKSGTGDASTGTQGGSITAAATGERWFLDCSDANIDVCGLYGVTFGHGAAMTFTDVNTEVVSCGLVDCSSADATGVGLFVRNVIADANTLDGVAFLTVDDMSDVDFCTFNFSDGHAIELASGGPASQASKGNRFLGYGATASNDAAIYNNSGATAKTITLSDGATSGEHTYRNGTSAATTIVAGAVTLLLTVTDIDDATAVQNARVLAYADAGGSMPADAVVTITRSGGTATVTHTSHGLATNDLVVIADAVQGEYNGVHTITVTGVSAYTYAVSGTPTTPATGTILSSEVIISGLTTAGGVVSDTRSYGSNQPIRGYVRKGGGSPPYKTTPLSGNTVDSTAGLSIAAQLIRD